MSTINVRSFSISLLFTTAIFVSCAAQNKSIPAEGNLEQEKFWISLQELCGKAYKGVVITAPANDTIFKGKALVMHVRSCTPSLIRIPFFVGENRSRTWVFSKSDESLQLKHDHRHEDGKEDSITQYGGSTTNRGKSTMQLFPADQETTNMLPAAAANVWWIDLVPGEYFTYNLRRIGTDRLFSIRFDLKKPVTTPPLPWGWID